MYPVVIECRVSRSGEMADARDSKSLEGNFMWVRLPPSAPVFLFILGILSPYGTSTPVGARPRHVAPRLDIRFAHSLKTSPQACFFTRRPLEGNFMWVRCGFPENCKIFRVKGFHLRHQSFCLSSGF